MPSQSEKNETLIAVIDAYAENAYGSSNTSDLSKTRSLAIERYLGRNINPAPEGRSQVRDRTVFETIEWIKPSLLRIYCGSDEVVRFEPTGPEDEKLAEQESFYVNYVVTQKNDWHQVCHDWFSDALLLKNGYVYVCWEEKTETESEFYENLTDDGLAFIQNDKNVEIVGHSERPNEELARLQTAQYQQAMQQWQQAAMLAQAQGQMPTAPPQEPPMPMLHDIEVKKIYPCGQVRLHVLAPERCRIDINTPNSSLEDCNYFEWFDFMTIGKLRSMGYKISDEVQDARDDIVLDSQEENSRDLYGESFDLQDPMRFEDPAMRRVKVRYVWIRHDYNGDGIDELQYVVLVGNEVLYREECTNIPIASMTPIPMAHRHVGMSMADVVADIEDVNTAFIRQGIDNLFFANNPRLLVSDRVNMSDLLDSKPGGVIRVDGQPPQEVMPIGVPDMFPNAIQAVNFFDQRRQNRTGINAYFQGTDANTLNKTASGISQLTNSAAQRVEMIARLFAPAVTKVFSLAHKLILQHGHQRDVIRMKGSWTSVDPREWKSRSDLRLVVGLGTGNKDSLLAQLSGMFQTQMAALQVGAVTPQNIFHTLKEIAKASSFTSPEQFATDPGPPQPPQKPLELTLKEMEAQVEQQKLAASQKGKADQLQFQVWQEKQRQMLEMWKTEQEQKLKIAIEQMKDNTTREIETSKIGLETNKLNYSVESDARAIEKEEQDKLLESSQSEVQEALGELSQKLNVLVQVSQAPKEIIRDKAGRPIGTRPILESIQMESSQEEKPKDLKNAFVNLANKVNEFVEASSSPKEVVRDESGAPVGVRIVRKDSE